MKWYSVKEYMPNNCDTYFVITNTGQLWTANFGCVGWETDYDGEEISGVTHFCIPDPVEIE